MLSIERNFHIAVVGEQFKGGTYKEVALSKETTLYRSYGGNATKFGKGKISWWKREPTRTTQAVIDNAIPATVNGNFASKLAYIKVPAGTKVYEGISAPIYAGKSSRMASVGGKKQIAIVGKTARWEEK